MKTQKYCFIFFYLVLGWREKFAISLKEGESRVTYPDEMMTATTM